MMLHPCYAHQRFLTQPHIRMLVFAQPPRGSRTSARSFFERGRVAGLTRALNARHRAGVLRLMSRPRVTRKEIGHGT